MLRINWFFIKNVITEFQIFLLMHIILRWWIFKHALVRICAQSFYLNKQTCKILEKKSRNNFDTAILYSTTCSIRMQQSGLISVNNTPSSTQISQLSRFVFQIRFRPSIVALGFHFCNRNRKVNQSQLIPNNVGWSLCGYCCLNAPSCPVRHVQWQVLPRNRALDGLEYGYWT